MCVKLRGGGSRSLDSVINIGSIWGRGATVGSNAFERGEDVEYDGRTCGRTSRYALSHYLGSDKTGSLPADFRLEDGLSFRPRTGSETEDLES